MREDTHIAAETWLKAMSFLGGEDLAEQAKQHGTIYVIRRGFHTSTIQSFATRTKLPQHELLNLLGLPRATYSRKARQGGQLAPDTSDRLFRLARITVRAEEVFGDEATALDWLRAPNQALGGERPYDLLDTDAGAEAVEDELGRIEYGVYA
jgi:putative toxin-antitoxin system antitoxin component (TIGR02293 family)